MTKNDILVMDWIAMLPITDSDARNTFHHKDTKQERKEKKKRNQERLGTSETFSIEEAITLVELKAVRRFIVDEVIDPLIDVASEFQGASTSHVSRVCMLFTNLTFFSISL